MVSRTDSSAPLPKRGHLHLELELGFGSTRALLSGRRPAVLEALRRLVRGHLDHDMNDVRREHGLTLTSPIPVARAVQQAIAEVIKDELGAPFGGWEDDWKIQVSPHLGPSFGGCGDAGPGMPLVNSPTWVGAWTDERTFALAKLDWGLNGVRDVWAEVAHWQPDSMVSGAFSSTLGLLGSGAVIVDRHEDEDGDYYQVRPARTDPRGIAGEIDDFLHTLGNFDQTWSAGLLLPLWALGFPTGEGGPAVPVVLLTRPYDDDWDDAYEVDGFSLTPPARAEGALRRLARPNAAQRRELLAMIRRYDSRPWRRHRLAEIHPAWAELIERLERD